MEQNIDLKEWFVKDNDIIDIRIKVKKGKKDELIGKLMLNLKEEDTISDLFSIEEIYFSKVNLESEIAKLKEVIDLIREVIRNNGF